MNSIFEIIKSRITPIQAAERYGMKIHRGSMVCCPFHEDKTPSMKLNGTYYYCFGCHTSGDVIDFAAKLHRISQLEAAKKLAADFGIDISDSLQVQKKSFVPFKHDTDNLTAKLAEIRRRAKTQNLAEWISYAQDVLICYRFLLCEWKEKYAPVENDSEWDPLFAEALQQDAFIEYLLDQAYLPDDYEQTQFYKTYNEEVKRIEQRIQQFTHERRISDDGRAA